MDSGKAFHKGSALDDHGACGQVEDLLRTLCDVCGLGFPVTGRFGNVIGRVEEDPAAKSLSVLRFPRPFVKGGFVTSLGSIDRRAGLKDRLLQLLCELGTVFLGRRWGVVIVMEIELRWWSRQGEVGR